MSEKELERANREVLESYEREKLALAGRVEEAEWRAEKAEDRYTQSEAALDELRSRYRKLDARLRKAEEATR